MWWNTDRPEIAHLVKRIEIRFTLCGKKYVPLFGFKYRMPRVEIQCKTCLLVSECLKDTSLRRTVENILSEKDEFIKNIANQHGLSDKQVAAALSCLPVAENTRDAAEDIDKYLQQAIDAVIEKCNVSDSVAHGVVTNIRIDHGMCLVKMNRREANRLAKERAQAKAQETARRKQVDEQARKVVEQIRKVMVERLNAQLQAESTAKRRAEHERQQQEQERKRQEAVIRRRLEADLIAQKRAEGRMEISGGCVVLVRDLEDYQDYTLYLQLYEPHDYVNGSKVYLDAPPIDVTPVSCDTPFSRGIRGKFVGDEVSIEAPSGTVRYQVLDVRHYSKYVKQQSGNTKVEKLSTVEHNTYAGRGKPCAGESQALDGSRNLGYMAREGSQWGSFPLYDDMSDEFDAEGQDYDDRFEVDSYDSDD